MKYAVLMYGDERVWPQLSQAERDAYFRAHEAFHEMARSRADLIVGAALADSVAATTLRREDERAVLTDGPFAETVEQLVGFYLVDAPDLDVMTEMCAKLPPAYTVEIRPLIDTDDEVASPAEASTAQ